MQARQQDSAPIVQPDNETFRQLNFIDRQAQQHQQELSAVTATTASPTRRIHIRLNDVEVPIDLNIHELRQALGLPGYDLCPPFRSRIIPATAEPHDVADDDHAEEKEDGGSDENEEANAEAKEDHNSREGTLV
ncbi:hypothetical protein PF010_g23826 [Phytophthora fragariae]|uniref:Uncharacterized protein n=1 Tax=Phytophthora fragariae TaxID=53985 RepID=A0A6G0K5A7_9STRA|nr:hypothetical protein PF010_g23826 [Phytophthora fragariae]